jgi:hypothetical protein
MTTSPLIWGARNQNRRHGLRGHRTADTVTRLMEFVRAVQPEREVPIADMVPGVGGRRTRGEWVGDPQLKFPIPLGMAR